VASCIQYDAFIRTLFRSFKYDGLMELAPFFGHLLVRRLHGDSLPHTDCIVPVPTTLERTRKRGYDHVQLLAAHLSSQTRQPIRRALVRLTDERGFTQSQSAKNAVERRRGLERVYTLNRQVPIRGCRILLIDDIATTGATLAACSEKLYLAGAQNVCALVVARVR
jgi:ComF family protein